jgi:hypothetical protein
MAIESLDGFDLEQCLPAIGARRFSDADLGGIGCDLQ